MKLENQELFTKMDYKNEFHSDDDFDCSNGYNDNYSNNNGNSNHQNIGQSRSGNPNGLSKAELRKTNKPIMEKRRRARINHCLNELKTLILEAMKKDPARHTKLEKADILEMTVKHLQSIQRQQLNMAIQTDPSVIHKFKTGFVECAEEVNRYVSQLEGIDATTRQRLNNHLNNCATSLEQIGAMTNFNNGYRHGQLAGGGGGGVVPGGGLLNSTLPNSAPIFSPLTQDLNNNNNNNNHNNSSRLNTATAGAIQMNGVQLIPSRLPSGELALIVPNTQAANVAAAANLLNNNTNNNLNNVNSFPTWPTSAISTSNTNTTPLLDPTAVTLPLINNFANQLQRMSAFSKPPVVAPTAIPTMSSILNIPMTQTKLPIIPNTTNTMPIKPKFHTTTAAAFHQNLPQNSTTTTSPPLSPISSVSSLSAGIGDDSSSAMHTNSVLIDASRPTTSPHEAIIVAENQTTPASQQHSFSGAFATPPLSTESSLCLSSTSASSSLTVGRLGSKHLQQQQVSSTSGCSDSSYSINKKRLLESSECADSSNGSIDEPASKKFAASTDSVVVSDVSDICGEELRVSPPRLEQTTSGVCKQQILQEERDSMWRPW